MLTLKHTTMLGDVPSGWQAEPLKNLLAAHYPGDWGDDGGPHMMSVLRSTNLTKDGRLDLSDVAQRALNPKRAAPLEPHAGDILLERSGGGPDQPVGRVGFINTDLHGHAFSNFLHLLRPNAQKVDPHFLGWILHQINRTGRVLRLEQQTTQMRNLNFREYLLMPLPIPTCRDEQTTIARVLDAADAAVEQARKTVTQARVLHRSLLHDLLQHGLDGQRSTDGKRPAHWQTKAVREVAEVGSGVTLGKDVSGFKSVELPYLRVANVQDGRLDLREIKTVRVRCEEVARFRLEAGDVLMTEGGDLDKLGRGTLWEGQIPECLHQNHVFRIRANRSQLDPRYFACVVESDIAKAYFMRVAKRTTNLASTNKTQVRAFTFPLPPPAEQEQIANVMDAIKEKRRTLLAKEAALVQLKASLLQNLLIGTVRVRPEQPSAIIST